MPRPSSSQTQDPIVGTGLRAKHSNLRAQDSGGRFLPRFSTEQQLIAAFCGMFGEGASRSWIWLRELNSPCGIADVVAVSLASDWQQQASIAHIPSRWLYALKSLPLGKELNAKKFALDFGISNSCAQIVLAAYASAGYCAHNARERTWIKLLDPLPIAEKIVAVEAKLRDWRRALYQAVQYASYAAEAWVVLDREAAHSATMNVDEFERRGIGLMGISTIGHSDILARPAPGLPRSQGRFWQANAEIAKRLFQKRTVVTS